MDVHDLDPDPLKQFERWFAEARDAGLAAPEAMALATATPDGRPSVRMVLMKTADQRGFDFYTHYESRKGGELTTNPHAALLFHWQPLGRQVRVEGRVVRIAAEESEAYFVTRPLESRLAAWASPRAARWRAGASSSACTPASRSVSRHRGAAATALGRLPPPARRLRVLAARRRPAPRPGAVLARDGAWLRARLAPRADVELARCGQPHRPAQVSHQASSS